MIAAKPTTERYSVEAVARALDILSAFRDAEELSLAEISKRVELNKSSEFRLLCTLVEKGYLEKTVDGDYVLGVKLLTLAARVRTGLKEVALPEMRKLRTVLNETVNLGPELLKSPVIWTSKRNFDEPAPPPSGRHPASRR